MGEPAAALLRTGTTALLLLTAVVVPPLAIGTVLQLVTGHLRRRAVEVFGPAVCVWATAPGVILHEFSHALFCLIFRHRITDFAPFAPQKNGNLGWVVHKWDPRNGWQNIGCFFIGVAPLAFGVAALVFLSLLLLPHDALPLPELRGNGLAAFRLQFRATFYGLWKMWITPGFLSRGQTWIWLYGVIAIGSQITLSRADLAGAKSGILVLSLLLIAAALLGALLLPAGAGPPSGLIRCSAAVCGMLFYFLLFFGTLTLLFELSLWGNSAGRSRP